MALFPRFGTEPPAKVAKPATVELTSRDPAANFRNCRNFRGTGGLEIRHRAKPDDLAQRVADLADAYAERLAIVLAAGDMGEADARRIAEAEIGAAFVRAFMPGEVEP